MTLLLLGCASSASALLDLVAGGGGGGVVLRLALHLVLVAALPARATGTASDLLLELLCLPTHTYRMSVEVWGAGMTSE